MRQEPKNTKRYQLNVDVNIKALLLAYRGGDTSIKISDLPSIEEIIEFEMGFVSASGIHVKEVEEIKPDTSPKGSGNASISINWHIEDVQGIALEKFSKSISDKDAFTVLEFLTRTHDAEVGVNWIVLEIAIETLLERKEITLVEIK